MNGEADNLDSSKPPGDGTGVVVSKAPRQMVQAKLLGAHSHTTVNGVNVQIWERSGKYLARGRHEGEPFGVTLGGGERDAASELRRVMAEIEAGTFLRPSDPAARKKRKQKPIPQLTLSELVDAFVEDKRRSCSRKTAETYGSRLAHVTSFAEAPDVRKRYPLAEDVDRDFALDLRSFLQGRQVARNGHANSKKKPMSVKHQLNIMEAVRDLFTWAAGPTVRKLPAGFASPFVPEIVGQKPRKNPLRTVDYGLDKRIRLVKVADLYQLIHVVPRFILPVRPEEICGLLITEVDFVQQTVRFGTRFDGRDWTKGQTDLLLPFPAELAPILGEAAGRRIDGPLLTRRSVFEGKQTLPGAFGQEPMAVQVDRAIAQAPPGELTGPNDSKEICRKVIGAAGGVTTDELNKEFQRMKGFAGVDVDAPFYNLRHSLTTEYARVGMPEAVIKYVTGHALTDILAEYTSLDIEQVRRELQKHWNFAKELLVAIAERAILLGIAKNGDTQSNLGAAA